jgi:DNA-binding transcriptional MerR regulator
VIETDDTELAPSRRPVKSEAAFRTISEVAEDLAVPQHVLRFWESKFSQIKPLKRGGGRRYYRPEDVAVLVRIRDLLYRDGYTIRGAQKFLREGGKALAAEPRPEAAPVDPQPPAVPAEETPETESEPVPAGVSRAELEAVLAEMKELRALLGVVRSALKG